MYTRKRYVLNTLKTKRYSFFYLFSTIIESPWPREWESENEEIAVDEGKALHTKYYQILSLIIA